MQMVQGDYKHGFLDRLDAVALAIQTGTPMAHAVIKSKIQAVLDPENPELTPEKAFINSPLYRQVSGLYASIKPETDSDCVVNQLRSIIERSRRTIG